MWGVQEAVERYVAASESLRKIFANVPSESTWLDDVVVDFIKSVVQVRCAAAGLQRWPGLGLVPDTHHCSCSPGGQSGFTTALRLWHCDSELFANAWSLQLRPTVSLTLIITETGCRLRGALRKGVPRVPRPRCDAQAMRCAPSGRTRFNTGRCVVFGGGKCVCHAARPVHGMAIPC